MIACLARWLALAVAAVLGVGAAGAQTVVPLTSGWEFVRAGSDADAPPANGPWQLVQVPHTWNASDVQAGQGFYEGVAWYRQVLPVGPALNGRQVFVRFEGVGQVAAVFLNGQQVGSHAGAYAAFTINLTPAWREQQANVLWVRADNRMRPDVLPTNNDLFMVFGGIYRPVSLQYTSPLHITRTDHGSPGVVIRQQQVGRARARIAVQVKVDNALTSTQAASLRVRVLNAQDREVARASQVLQVAHAGTQMAEQVLLIDRPTLWHGRRNPYLYRVVTELVQGQRVVDAVTQPLGLRSWAFDARRGFMLNGEPYRLYGVTRHQEWQDLGSALSDEQHRADMAMMTEIGATALRLAHYQQAETMYAEADRLGLLVWAEIPWVAKASGQEGPNARLQLTELIRQNINHPAIFVWGLLNEVNADKASDAQVALVRELHDLAKTEDPGRPTVTVSQHGRLEDTMNWHAELQAMNRYVGWYGGRTEELADWLQMVAHERPQGGVAIGEYGAEGNVNQHAEDVSTHDDPITGQLYPEQYQSRFHEIQWALIDHNPNLWASFVWNMFDFAVPRWNRGGVPARNQKGLVSYDRKTKKDAFYFYKANWSAEPVLHIADKRLQQRQRASMTVTVYSNLGAPRVTLNGRDLGAAESGGSKAHWVWRDVLLQIGQNQLQAQAQRAGRTYADAAEFVRVAP